MGTRSMWSVWTSWSARSNSRSRDAQRFVLETSDCRNGTYLIADHDGSPWKWPDCSPLDAAVSSRNCNRILYSQGYRFRLCMDDPCGRHDALWRLERQARLLHPIATFRSLTFSLSRKSEFSRNQIRRSNRLTQRASKGMTSPWTVSQLRVSCSSA